MNPIALIKNRIIPRDAQRAALSNEVALYRLSYYCVFCEEVVFPPCLQQASDVAKMACEAVLHYTAYLLQARCASRGMSPKLSAKLPSSLLPEFIKEFYLLTDFAPLL